MLNDKTLKKAKKFLDENTRFKDKILAFQSLIETLEEEELIRFAEEFASKIQAAIFGSFSYQCDKLKGKFMCLKFRKV
jgi:hypothetical protein